MSKWFTRYSAANLLASRRTALYEYLSSDARAIRLGFDSEKSGTSNTAPTRQTQTTVWDAELSDAKRSILAVSERLVDAAYEHEEALPLRSPQLVKEHESDLRERHISEYSNERIRQKIRLARDTIFGAFDSGRAESATYPPRKDVLNESRTAYLLFCFGILVYNVWRLTDVLLKATVAQEITDYMYLPRFGVANVIPVDLCNSVSSMGGRSTGRIAPTESV